MNDFASSDTTGFGGKSTLFAFTITFSRRIFSWRERSEVHGCVAAHERHDERVG